MSFAGPSLIGEGGGSPFLPYIVTDGFVKIFGPNNVEKVVINNASGGVVFNVDTVTPAVTVGAELILPALRGPAFLTLGDTTIVQAATTIPFNTTFSAGVSILGANSSTKFTVMDNSPTTVFNIDTSADEITANVQLTLHGDSNEPLVITNGSYTPILTVNAAANSVNTLNSVLDDGSGIVYAGSDVNVGVNQVAGNLIGSQYAYNMMSVYQTGDFDGVAPPIVGVPWSILNIQQGNQCPGYSFESWETQSFINILPGFYGVIATIGVVTWDLPNTGLEYVWDNQEVGGNLTVDGNLTIITNMTAQQSSFLYGPVVCSFATSGSPNITSLCGGFTNNPGIEIAGSGLDSSSDVNNGIALILQSNQTNNRQLLIGDSSLIASGGQCLRIATVGTAIHIDNFTPNTSTSNPLRISNNCIPSADNSFSCGQSGSRWTAVWAVNGAIQTSDIVDKEAVEDIEKDCLSVVRMLRPKKYRWRNCKRQHRGFIANEITETLERIGMRHDGLIYKDDENRLGMSYSELTPILWKAVQQMADKIEELEKLIGVKK